MLKLPIAVAVALQATLGAALTAAWANPTIADNAPANTATQSPTTPRLHKGDLVRLRSGGPALIVKSIWGNWAICTWFDDYGDLQSAGFPIAMIAGPITASGIQDRPTTQ
jgi:uncharacterized protein YodC (DUF2158 family)